MYGPYGYDSKKQIRRDEEMYVDRYGDVRKRSLLSDDAQDRMRCFNDGLVMEEQRKQEERVRQEFIKTQSPSKAKSPNKAKGAIDMPDDRILTRSDYGSNTKEEIFEELKDTYGVVDKLKEDLARAEKQLREPKVKMSINDGKYKNDKGCNNMFNMKKIFGEFGKVTDGSVALTLSGNIAVKRSEDEYVRYDSESGTMDNQMNMVIKDSMGMVFILPVTTVEPGDIIKKHQSYCQILEVTGTSMKAVNIKTGTKTTIIKETNVFGLSFLYKVVSLFDGLNNTTAGINPMVLMMLSDGKDDDSMLPLLLLSTGGINGGSTGGMGGINPMMLMMLSKDKGGNTGGIDVKDMLMMQMMQQGQGQQSAMNAMSPMMLMAMAGDGEMGVKDLLMMQMLQQGQQGQNKAKGEI